MPSSRERLIQRGNNLLRAADSARPDWRQRIGDIQHRELPTTPVCSAEFSFNRQTVSCIDNHKSFEPPHYSARFGLEKDYVPGPASLGCASVSSVKRQKITSSSVCSSIY